MTSGISQRVRRSMGSLLFARPLAAISGLLYLTLLSRGLSASDYGVYFGLWALVEILTLASNCGLLYGAYRYVRASIGPSGTPVPSGPVGTLLALRLLTLGTVAGALLLKPDALSWLNTGGDIARYVPFLALMVLGEGTARYVEIFFDSMLCQGRAQVSQMTRPLLRLAGCFYFSLEGPLGLEQVLWAEMVALAAGNLVSLGMLARLLWTPTDKPGRISQAGGDAPLAFRRVIRFVLPAFVAELLGLAYGPDALKLALASTTDPSTLALFGFCFSVSSVVQRYIPANLLAGIIRPVFVAAATRADADSALSGLVTLVIKINWLMILPLLLTTWAIGDPLLHWVSGGNYSGAATVTALLVGGLLPMVVHLVLAMYCLAQEDSRPVLVAAACSALGLPLGVFLASRHGALGAAMAFCLSEVIWSGTAWAMLRLRYRARLRVDLRGLMGMPAVATAAFGVVLVLQGAGAPPWVGAAASVIAFAAGLFVWPPFSSQERVWLASVLPLPARWRPAARSA